MLPARLRLRTATEWVDPDGPPREPALRSHRRVLRSLRRGVVRSRLPQRADDHLRAYGATRVLHHDWTPPK